MVCIIDYGVGNLFSLKCSLGFLGVECIVSGNSDDIRRSDRIILPGVGAFSDAAAKLRKSGLDKVILDEARNGKEILGICLGMQMLFDRSFEDGEWQGLGLIPGDIRPFYGAIPKNFKIPHIGWNSLEITEVKTGLLEGVRTGDHVYFVHSYYADCAPKFVCAYGEYSIKVPAVVKSGNVMGCQFHPEKSSAVGLKILKNFCGGKPC